MKTQQEKKHETDFLELGEDLVGKKVFDKILTSPQSYENDDDLDDNDDDQLTPSQIQLIQELKKKIKR
jgi:hypothetical protein